MVSDIAAGCYHVRTIAADFLQLTSESWFTIHLFLTLHLVQWSVRSLGHAEWAI